MIVDYKGGKVFYNVTGTGPACVLLHGFLENLSIWNAGIKELRDTHKIINIDLPGHGRSDVLPHEASMAEMAAAVLKVVEKENAGAIDLVGHSMGGYVGLAFAKAYTEKVNGLLLLNSTPVADTEERVANRKHGIVVAKKNYEAIVNMSVGNLFDRQNRKKLERDIENLKKEALKTPLKGYIDAQNAMMNREDLSTFWKNASFKKAMVLGKNDTLIDAFETKTAFIDKIPVIAILSGGHVLFLENPKKTYQKIKDFLNDDLYNQGV